ncbi:MAG: hypothetical protein QM664_11050 [Flavihumibacter sp.]
MPGLQWYIGGGVAAYNSFSNKDYYRGFGLGLFPTGGVDYKFGNIPLNVSADFRPTSDWLILTTVRTTVVGNTVLLTVVMWVYPRVIPFNSIIDLIYKTAGSNLSRLFYILFVDSRLFD